MKRTIIVLLLLSLSLLCFGCEKKSEDPGPQIRYEGTTATYTQEGAKYTMDLRFSQTVPKGSIISVCLGETELLSFTTEADLDHLNLSSVKLELGQAYTLKVNGIPQIHGNGRDIATIIEPHIVTTEPGDIPEPTLSTVTQEPMGQIEVSVESTEEESQSDSPFGTPPTISTENITIETFFPTDEEAQTEATTLDSAEEEEVEQTTSAALKTEIRRGGTTFVLTAYVTGFTSVRNGS